MLVRRVPPVLRAGLDRGGRDPVDPAAPAPLLVSTDAWTYWEYGRIAAVHDGDPYVDTPSEFPNDPAYDKAGADWRDTTSVYGPAFTLFSEGVALVSGSSAAAAAWIFKVLAALGMLACTLLAARLARDKVYAAALVGWNPLLRDPLRRRRPQRLRPDRFHARRARACRHRTEAARRRGLGAGGADQVGPARLLRASRRRGARVAGGRVGHAGFAVVAAAVIGLATWRYGVDWLRSFGPLARNAAEQSSYALPHRLEQLGVPHGVDLSCSPARARRRARCGSRERPRAAGFGSASRAASLLATTPWLTPWYAIWALRSPPPRTTAARS